VNAGTALTTVTASRRLADVSVSLAELRKYNPRLGNVVFPLPEFGVVYVKNAKAACSTVTLWLDRIHTGDLDFNPTNVHKEHRLPRPKDIGWRRLQRMLEGEALRFTVVRDPLTRAESAWHNKIRVRRGPGRVQLQTVLGLPADPERALTFEEFVAALEAHPDPRTMDRHWRPQHLNLMHPILEYDHVCRVETLDQDLAVLRDTAGLPDVPLETRNVTTGDGSSVYDGRPDLVRRVRALYAEDIELYGYDRSTP
jgi:hypothetical protein